MDYHIFFLYLFVFFDFFIYTTKDNEVNIMIKIVVDAFGGDNAPNEVVSGVVSAINSNEKLHIILTGKEEVLMEVLSGYKYNDSQISIIDAREVISNNESATEAIRQKKDSSLVKALDCAKEDDEVVGIISAGSTGAVLTGAFMKLGRMKGVLRPALCPIIPTAQGTITSICDCGANVDCKPEYLHQFAIMGNAYLKVLGVKNPRVALLNVGTEDHKGDVRSKETFELLKNSSSKINFVGNMEARDLLSGDYDLVVTDGFAGNVLLKSTEGAIKNLLTIMKNEIKASFFSKIGALFMKKTFKNIKKGFDYSNHGGAVLLGCKKLVVKSHGSSTAKNFLTCINQVVTMAEGKLVENISKSLEKVEMSNE